MERFIAAHLYEMMSTCSVLMVTRRDNKVVGGLQAEEDINLLNKWILGLEYFRLTTRSVQYARRMVEDFDSARRKAEKTDSADGGYTNRAFIERVGVLRERIEDDLGDIVFMFMPPTAAKYYDKRKLFGHKVFMNFKSTRDDVIEAGNCFAVGRYTACVFHCMRVLEKGLHALVHDLNNRYNAGITFRRTIEETNWGNIIDEIQNTLTQSRRRHTLNPTPTQRDLSFYATAAREFEFFKNAWRDDVSHSRASYGEDTAKDVLEHVRAFMQHLSSRLCE